MPAEFDLAAVLGADEGLRRSRQQRASAQNRDQLSERLFDERKRQFDVTRQDAQGTRRQALSDETFAELGNFAGTTLGTLAELSTQGDQPLTPEQARNLYQQGINGPNFLRLKDRATRLNDQRSLEMIANMEAALDKPGAFDPRTLVNAARMRGADVPTEKFGEAKPAIGPDGREVMAQFGDRGTGRAVPGFAPRPTSAGVTVNNIGPNSIERIEADRFSSIQGAGNAAMEQIGQLDILDTLDIDGGSGADFRLGIRELGQRVNNMFGVAVAPVDDEAVDNAQAYLAVGGRMVLDVMAQQKGPQTDADQQRIASTLPQLTNADDARDFISASLRGLALRRAEMADFYDQWYAEHGSHRDADGMSVNRAWRDRIRSVPLVSDRVALPGREHMPTFFWEYRRTLKRMNPGVSESDIVSAWQQKNAAE